MQINKVNMVKDIVDANENVMSNTKEMEILHEHFPQCFNSRNEFDIDKFKELISDNTNVIHEGYSLDFLGKSYAKLLASIDTTTVIKPDIEHNNKPENKDSKNIYISGDNLDALKHLLKSYHGSVKCIYIDPPYNTGSDGFVYNDKFNFTADDLEDRLSIDYEQAIKILDMTSRGSASHSAWLTFMAPRLQIARDLLTNDGVIFISIDDNEQSNLKLLCDNIYGEENFIAVLKWKRKKQPSFLATHTANVMEYVLVYAKNSALLQKLSIEGTSDFTKKVINISNGESVRHFKSHTRVKLPGEGVIPAGRYKIRTMEVEYLDDVKYRDGYTENDVDVLSRFSVSQEKITSYINDGLLFITAQKGLRRDVSKEEIGKRKSITDLLLSEWGDNQESDEEIKHIFGASYFDYAKPVKLIYNLIKCNQPEESIVLDFFSGSATTAHAVMQYNAENTDSNVRYILVQLPEDLDDNYKKADVTDKTKIQNVISFLDTLKKPHRLDEIGMERIKRVGSEIVNKKSDSDSVDVGFKHYTLEEQTEQTLDKLERFDKNVTFTDDNILSLFGRETVLETWMVKDGYGFGADVKPVKLDEYTAYLMDNHLYLVDTDFDKDDMVALIDKYNGETGFNPENIVVFGYSFTFAQLDMLQHNLITLNDGIKNKKVNVDVRY